MPKLVYQDPESGQEVTIEINDSMPVVTIGRNPGNIVRVNNPSISRQHAKIVWEGSECTLFDLDSSNGSYVNGTRVRSQALIDKDRIRVGEFPIDYQGDVQDLVEISADQIEPVDPGSWEDGTPKSSTNLGGFAAHIDEESGPDVDYSSEVFESGFSDPVSFDDEPYNAGPIEFDDPAPISFDEPPPGEFDLPPVEDPTFDANSPINFDDSDPLQFDEPSLAEESSPFDNDPSFPDVASDEHNNASSFPRSEVEVDEDDIQTIDDNAIISVEPSEAVDDNAFQFGVEPSGPVEGLVEPSMNDQDTFEASLEELNEHLQRVSEAVDDDDGEDPLSSLSGRSEVPEQIEMYEERIKELETERDDLLDLLQDRVGDIAGGSKIQIDRLRTERDRLIEERRRMQREIRSLRGQLDSLPTPESIAQMELELSESRQTASEHENIVEALQGRIADLMGAVDTAQLEVASTNEQLQKFREAADAGEDAAAQLVTTTADLENAKNEIVGLTEQTEAALAELRDVRETYDRMVEEKATLEATLDAREGEIAQLSHQADERTKDIEELQTQLGAAHERIDALILDRDGLATELESRPPSDEVQNIVSQLATTRADLEAAQLTIEDLETLRDGLLQESADQRELFSALEERFEKQGAEFEIVERERDALKTEKGAFARETDYLQVEKRQLDSELRALKKEMKENDANDRRKKQIFDELRGDLERLVGENTALEEKLATLQAAVDNAPSAQELADAKAQREDADELVATLQKTLAALEKDANATAEELGSTIQDREALAQQLENANIELDALREVVSDGSDALGKIESLEKAKKKLESTLKKTESDRDKKAMENEQLASQLAEKEVEVAELRDDSKKGESDLAQKVNKLEGQLLDAEKTLAEIILERDRLEDELKKSKN